MSSAADVGAAQASKKHQTASTPSSSSCAVPVVVADGLRYVQPYTSDLVFFCKKRWWNTPLLDMLKAEYKNPIADYYERLLSHGHISVTASGKKQPLAASSLPSHILRANDRICIRMHRHEPPVPDAPIQILHYEPAGDASAAASVSTSASTSESSASVSAHRSETIVVNKPAGIPVHASGRYLHNTVVGRLMSEHGIEAFPVHRLDRITSGLLLLSLTRSNASVLGRELQDRVVSKSYVARVRGQFPEGKIVVDDAIQLRGEGEANRREAAAAAAATAAAATVVDATATEASAASAAESSCAIVAPAAAPTSASARSIAPANPFMSAHVPARLKTAPSASAPAAAYASASSASPSPEGATAHGQPIPSPASAADGKSASTEFERISFDGCTSLVRCRPLSGRTHQIRVHLSGLGHPIANDYLYGGQLLASNTYRDRMAVVMRDAGAPSLDGCAECEAARDEAQREDEGNAAALPPAAPVAPSAVTTPLYCHSIWLHCATYAGAGWSYACPWPAWAADDFDSHTAMAHPVDMETGTAAAAAAAPIDLDAQDR